MPLNLDIKKKLNSRIGKVKCVDIHETETWILAALYNGKLIIFDYANQNTIKNIEVSAFPLRCAKFIEKKQWILCAGDDMTLRVYNYNTFEKIKSFEDHTDYIRYIEVHQTLPYVLTSSDDMTIKLYDYENNFEKLCSFENHIHYVMMCKFNPKDTYIFASASLDKTIKIWGVQNNTPVVTKPHFTLTGHTKGVNCIDYSCSGETSYIISGSDDKTIRIWDYHTKQCIQVLSGHTQNVSCLIYHNNLPIIVSSSEDCNVKIWNSSTFKLESTLNYNMDRCWSLCAKKTKNDLCIGYDEGLVVIQIGSDKPIFAMFKNKIIYIKNTDIYIINLQNVSEGDDYNDGDVYKVNKKELGNCDFYPTNVSFHPSGRFICVSGHHEFNIYTSQVLRNKAYGKSAFFVWAHNGDYAIKEEGNKINIYKDFTSYHSFQAPFTVLQLFGGYLLGVKSSNFICFYDWNDYSMVRKIDINVKNVYWNEAGTYVALTTEDTIYILSYLNGEGSRGALKEGNNIISGVAAADGLDPSNKHAAQDEENNFELESEINEAIESGIWIYDSFLYVSKNLRLYIYTKKFIDIYAYIDKYLYICGYVYEYDRIFLLDKNYTFHSFFLPITYLQYQKYVMNKDLASADLILKKIPESLYNKLSLFLEKMGHKNEALNICTDLEKKFELSLSIGNLQLCVDIIKDLEQKENNAFIHNKYKALGDTALVYNDVPMAIYCYKKTNDFSSLLIILSTLGDKLGLEELGTMCVNNHKLNIAFICFFLLHKVNKCVDILLSDNNFAYAAFFARVYKPSLLPSILLKWKEHLNKVYTNAPVMILTPDENPEYFPEYEQAVKCESIFDNVKTVGRTQNYNSLKKLIDLNILEEIKEIGYEKVEDIFLKQFNEEMEKDVQNFDMMNSFGSTKKKEEPAQVKQNNNTKGENKAGKKSKKKKEGAATPNKANELAEDQSNVNNSGPNDFSKMEDTDFLNNSDIIDLDNQDGVPPVDSNAGDSKGANQSAQPAQSESSATDEKGQ
ncbi:coatomer subunit beta, putative [Plasmodium vivax]|uniref:Coatomer subunit beta' n=1 Tax=Plasmodium vivax (strain Brazil I) TaxID=1033975 RepID=A0A0J9SWV5_PLAV1|nr:coatomer complex beta subunit [Plasmodium vivax Brazil I]CAI7719498.1 coatomer subunit beta, putative [Plasmodium vivax]